MRSRLLACVLALCVCAGAAPAAQIVAVPADKKIDLRALPMHIGGRVLARGTSETPKFERQWPGTYFETEFSGSDAYFKVGPGEVILKVSVDGEALQPLVKPAAGLYRVQGLKDGKHGLRVEVITEGQAGPTEFDGFYGPPATKAIAAQPHARQIEFIGDSHTVGYGNTSPKRECTEGEVWATTDTSQGIAPLVARRDGADYQVNAISGRGIVRNYGGFAGDTLPVAYPFVLLDHNTRYGDASWHPKVIVISLGTNDFSTALHAGEKWKSRDELHADYEKTYVEFLRQLRAKNPDAYFVLWATDTADGEVASEVQRVAQRVRGNGEKKLAVVPMKDLGFTACNYHPSLADDRKIADAVSAAIDAGVKGWKK